MTKTQDIILKAIEIDVQPHKAGKPIPFSDIIIAAISTVMNARLITLDIRHFKEMPSLKPHIPKLENT